MPILATLSSLPDFKDVIYIPTIVISTPNIIPVIQLYLCLTVVKVRDIATLNNIAEIIRITLILILLMAGIYFAIRIPVMKKNRIRTKGRVDQFIAVT